MYTPKLCGVISFKVLQTASQFGDGILCVCIHALPMATVSKNLVIYEFIINNEISDGFSWRF